MTDLEKRARFRRQMGWIFMPIWGLCFVAGKVHGLLTGQAPRPETLFQIGAIVLLVVVAAIVPPLEDVQLRRRARDRAQRRPPLDLAS